MRTHWVSKPEGAFPLEHKYRRIFREYSWVGCPLYRVDDSDEKLMVGTLELQSGSVGYDT